MNISPPACQRFALARDTDHKSKVAAGASLNSGDRILNHNRPPRLNAEQPCRLGIEVADGAILVDRVHALDDAAEHRLRLGVALPQRTGQRDEIAPHILHGVRQRPDLGCPTRRNGGREVAPAEAGRRRGQRPHRARESLEPVTAGVREAEALEVAEGAPLMLVERVAYAQTGQPVEFARDLFRGDRTRIVMWTSELAGVI